MARVSPEEAAKKLVTRTTAASDDYRRGVQRVANAPTADAAKAIDNWQARVSSAETKDKMRRGLGRVTLQDWQQATLDKGANRLASGVQAAEAKSARFFQQFLPHLDAGVAKVNAMPKGGVENGVARATTMIRHNASFKRTQ